MHVAYALRNGHGKQFGKAVGIKRMLLHRLLPSHVEVVVVHFHVHGDVGLWFVHRVDNAHHAVMFVHLYVQGL